MDIFYETYKIIKNDKELRKWIKKNGKEAYKILRWKFFKSKLSIKEKIDNELIIFEQLIANKEFENKFTDKLNYLSFVLSHIMLSVKCKNRGLLISNLFLNGKILYFPRQVEIKDYKTKFKRGSKYNQNLCFITDDEYSYKYKFYGISLNNKLKTYKYFNDELIKMSQNPNDQTEEKTFLEFLKSENIHCEMYSYLIYNNNTNTFYFDKNSSRPFSDEEEDKDTLTFINRENTISSIAEELKYFLKND